MTGAGSSPRAVVGLPLYNGATHLAEALEALLTQTQPDLAVVMVDDCSTDATPEVARRYADLDSRLAYHRNDRRIGLSRNWQAALELALARFPDAAFFAWASDHDVCHPRWLEALVRALDEHPEAMLAFPDVALLEDGALLRPLGRTRDTLDVHGPVGVLNRTIRGGLSRGNMVYGLFRASALVRAGGFPQVLIPDKLVVSAVALQGPVVRVPEVLWYRRPTAAFDVARQRRAIYPDGVPLAARAPWPLLHAVRLVRTIGFERQLAPVVPARKAPLIAALYLLLNMIASSEKRARKTRKKVSRLSRKARSRGRGILRRAPGPLRARARRARAFGALLAGRARRSA